MPRGAINTMESITRDHVSVIADGCWVWTAKVGKNGYGHANIEGRFFGAHRLFYTHFKGPIPPGYHVDHLCKNRACVNPEHLEAVTAAENNRRSTSPSALNANKTECLHGHALDGANLYVTPTGRRNCKRCRADAVARSIRKRGA